MNRKTEKKRRTRTGCTIVHRAQKVVCSSISWAQNLWILFRPRPDADEANQTRWSPTKDPRNGYRLQFSQTTQGAGGCVTPGGAPFRIQGERATLSLPLLARRGHRRRSLSDHSTGKTCLRNRGSAFCRDRVPIGQDVDEPPCRTSNRPRMHLRSHLVRFKFKPSKAPFCYDLNPRSAEMDLSPLFSKREKNTHTHKHTGMPK